MRRRDAREIRRGILIARNERLRPTLTPFGFRDAPRMPLWEQAYHREAGKRVRPPSPPAPVPNSGIGISTRLMPAAAHPSVIEAVRVLQQAGAEPEMLIWLAKVAATARLTTEDVNVLAFRYGIRIIPSALQTTARRIAIERAAALGDAADALLELGLDTRRANAIDIVRRLQSAEKRKADAL